MENTENKKTTSGKVKNFFQKRKMEFALFVAMVATCMFTGIGFGTLLGVAIFLWATAYVAELPKYGSTLSTIMRLAVVCVFIYSLIVPNMPRSVNNADVGWANFDMGVSSLMGDKTETRARDIWQIKKNEKGRKFLAYYNFLLSQERTIEARDTLSGFLKAWDLDRKEQRLSNGDPAQVQSQSQLAPSGNTKPTVLHPGVYYYVLKAGQRTPWFTTPDCSKYHLNTKSETYNQRLFFSDGTDFMDGPTVNIADKYGANMQILAYVDEVVTVTVTLA